MNTTERRVTGNSPLRVTQFGNIYSNLKFGLHHLPEVTYLTLWRHYENTGSHQQRSRFDIALL